MMQKQDFKKIEEEIRLFIISQGQKLTNTTPSFHRHILRGSKQNCNLKKNKKHLVFVKVHYDSWSPPPQQETILKSIPFSENKLTMRPLEFRAVSCYCSAIRAPSEQRWGLHGFAVSNGCSEKQLSDCDLRRRDKRVFNVLRGLL